MADTMKWRRGAKIVAYLDLILTSMALFIVIVTAIVAGAATSVIQDDKMVKGNGDHFTSDEKSTIVAYLWIVVSILAVFTAIQLWAAIQLMKATEIGRGPVDAHKLSETWRNVCILFLIIEVAYYVVTGPIVLIVIPIVLRGIYLIVVWNFMEELRTLVAPDPTMVTTMKV